MVDQLINVQYIALPFDAIKVTKVTLQPSLSVVFWCSAARQLVKTFEATNKGVATKGAETTFDPIQGMSTHPKKFFWGIDGGDAKPFMHVLRCA